jgi:hypothetical protein
MSEMNYYLIRARIFNDQSAGTTFGRVYTKGCYSRHRKHFRLQTTAVNNLAGKNTEYIQKTSKVLPIAALFCSHLDKYCIVRHSSYISESRQFPPLVGDAGVRKFSKNLLRSVG